MCCIWLSSLALPTGQGGPITTQTAPDDRRHRPEGMVQGGTSVAGALETRSEERFLVGVGVASRGGTATSRLLVE